MGFLIQIEMSGFQAIGMWIEIAAILVDRVAKLTLIGMVTNKPYALSVVGWKTVCYCCGLWLYLTLQFCHYVGDWLSLCIWKVCSIFGFAALYLVVVHGGLAYSSGFFVLSMQVTGIQNRRSWGSCKADCDTLPWVSPVISQSCYFCVEMFQESFELCVVIGNILVKGFDSVVPLG